MKRSHALVVCCLVALGARAASSTSAADLPAEQVEFFESHIRPVLVEHCYECHSGQSKVLKGGLRVDSRSALIKGGDSGEAVIPGKPAESPMIQAVRWEAYEMPPNGKLKPDQVAALEKWVELGAPWPGDSGDAPPPAGRTYDWKQLQAEHWAWRPVQRPPLPPVRDVAWPVNPIDVFILNKLEGAGLKPNPPAEPRALVRRLYFDLIGLPPTPEEVESFVRDFSLSPSLPVSRSSAQDKETGRQGDRERAYLALVDRLLESPQYGERWGRHWLDVARYSDGYGGFLDSASLPSAWRYRDWVVGALNRDVPYDEFIRLQLAGDLIDRDHAVATGFLALGPTYISDGGDPEATAQAKAETLDDRVDTLTRGLMAMTVSCARCHDHRFDPYPQLDYYSLAGVLNNTQNREIPLASPEVVKAYDDYERKIKDLEQKSRQLRGKIRTESRATATEERKQLDDWDAEVAALKKNKPQKYPVLHALADIGSNDMPLALRGNPLKPGEIAPRRFLRIIAGSDPPPFRHGSGRLELAEAVVAPTNPLTPRVIVNRIWQQHFGQALVRTPSNFGKLGETPTHPELLDWLAAEFMQGTGGRIQETAVRGQGTAARPWSLKALHRLIVTSAAYRMDAAPHDEALALDGDNRLVWRMNPRRLDVEAWRDAVLAATGELDQTLGGPPIEDIAGSERRTLYASVSRNGDKFSSDTFLRLFDFPVPRATSEGRTSSIVPQQSLFLMNSPFMATQARHLVERLQREEKDDVARIRRAYLLLYGRPATAEEVALGREFVSIKFTESSGRLNPWQQYAQVLLSASELMHVE